MRILFMGTPEFAETALSALADRYRDDIVGVVTRMDMPKNRGHILTPPPVKVKAEALGIPVYQPVNLKAENFGEILQTLAPELIVVAAYGKLLPTYVLRAPRYGCINIHGSLLPKYRGAAPIQRAILAGEPEMGVTIMRMEEGLDTGDMLLKGAFPLSGTENYGEIHDKMAKLGAALLLEAIEKLEKGALHPEKQDDSFSTYAAKIEKADRILDFSAPAEELQNRIRAFSPLPGAEAELPSGKLKITAAIALHEPCDGDAGTVSALSPKGDGRLVVNCGRGKLCILRLIPEGKKEMSAGDFIRGRRIAEHDRFL